LLAVYSKETKRGPIISLFVKTEILFHFFPHSRAFILAFQFPIQIISENKTDFAFYGKLAFITLCSLKGRLSSNFSIIHLKTFEIENCCILKIQKFLIHTLKYPPPPTLRRISKRILRNENTVQFSYIFFISNITERMILHFTLNHRIMLD